MLIASALSARARVCMREREREREKERERKKERDSGSAVRARTCAYVDVVGLRFLHMCTHELVAHLLSLPT